MATTVGILVFDGVDELDFVGPLDVFSYAAGWGSDGNRVVTIARERALLKGVNGLSFLPEYDFPDAPPLDVLVVTGGHGTGALIADTVVLDWLRAMAASALWVCSVCTGSFVLQAAGLVDRRRITTHSAMIDQLRETNRGEVVAGERFVADGNFVTSAGVSAGIDMSLWVVGALYGQDHARTVRARLDYDPRPPY